MVRQLHGSERRTELLVDPVGRERGRNARGGQHRGPESECEFGSLGAACEVSVIELRNLVVSHVSKVGSPGNLYIAAPCVFVV